MKTQLKLGLVVSLMLASSLAAAQPKRAPKAYRVVLTASETLVVVPERSPRTSDRQTCWRRPLEQGRGAVMVCDVRGGK